MIFKHLPRLPPQVPENQPLTQATDSLVGLPKLLTRNRIRGSFRISMSENILVTRTGGGVTEDSHTVIWV
jgi:hypothetical protein